MVYVIELQREIIELTFHQVAIILLFSKPIPPSMGPINATPFQFIVPILLFSFFPTRIFIATKFP